MKEFRLVQELILKNGEAVDAAGQKITMEKTAVDLSVFYSNFGADMLMIRDISDTDEEHEKNIDTVKEIVSNTDAPVLLGGNVKRLEDVKKYIYAHYLGKNKSSDKVCKNLYLMKKVKGSMFVVSWFSDDEKIISEQGKVYGSRISKPQQVGLTAVIKYEAFKEKLRFNVIVTPVKLLSDAMEKPKSLRYFKLPEKVAGKKIKYGINRYEPLWKLTAIMAVMFIVVPYLLESMTKSKVSDREKQLKLAYPEMIEKFVLLVNAGLPVKNAWIRITETEGEKSKANNYTDKNYLSKNYRDNYYLIEEMLLTRRQMENGLSEEKAYELFGRRIGLLSYMKFCTLLVQNMKKGTADLIRILEYESADVFNERKENVKILGEEAGTKLLLPMMIMMVIIFAIIMYAAFAGM